MAPLLSLLDQNLQDSECGSSGPKRGTSIGPERGLNGDGVSGEGGSHHPPAFPFGWFQVPPSAYCKIFPPQFKISEDISMMSAMSSKPRGPTAISPLWVGLPTRRKPALGRAHPIFDQEALHAPAPLLGRQFPHKPQDILWY